MEAGLYSRLSDWRPQRLITLKREEHDEQEKDQESLWQPPSRRREGSARHPRGEADPDTYRVYEPADVGVREIHGKLGLTQEEFATRFGLPVGKIRD
jgi:hypothetical protein